MIYYNQRTFRNNAHYSSNRDMFPFYRACNNKQLFNYYIINYWLIVSTERRTLSVRYHLIHHD